MIAFIPLDHYARVYYWIMTAFIISLAVMLVGHPKAVVESTGIRNPVVRFWGVSCLVVLVVLLGLRPISYAFGDMGNYYKHFLAYESGASLQGTDVLFESIMLFFARFLNAPAFFLVCVVLYLVPMAVAARRWLGNYWPLAFFLAAAHFDFYGYGVNGIRQGIASSILLLALSQRGGWSWVLVLCAVGFHGSLIVPALAYALVQFVKRPAIYFTGWACCLAATSLTGWFGAALLGSGIGDEKLDRYIAVDTSFIEQFSKVGFRYDFLLYSLIPIVLGFHAVFARKVKDRTYIDLLNVYLTANAFWLLMIRTPISNRIAYLSWFLMGVLIAYPLIRFRLFKGQHYIYVGLLLVIFGYTFYSNL